MVVSGRPFFSTLLADRHLGEAVVAECVKHFVGNTSLETFDRFRYKKRIYVNLVVISEKCLFFPSFGCLLLLGCDCMPTTIEC